MRIPQEAPPDPLSPDDPEHVRLALADMNARLDTAREHRLVDYLGGIPWFGDSCWTGLCVMGFSLSLAAGLIAVAISHGTVTRVLAATALVTGICVLAAVPRAVRRARRFHADAAIVPCAIVAAHPQSGDAEQTLSRGCFAVVTQHRASLRRPRELVALAERLAAATTAAPTGDAEIDELVADLRRRIPRWRGDARPERVPGSWSGDAETWLVEFMLDHSALPNRRVDSRLLFTMATVDGDGPARLALGDPDYLWGRAGHALAAMFPFDPARPSADEAGATA